jgi:chemotaxis protein CheX
MDIAPEDLESIAENVWGTTLGIAVSRLPEWAGPEAAASMLVGVVRIRGAWHGSVVVHCPRELAAAAAAIIFSIDDGTTATPVEMQDALLELTNMIGGNMKALLPEPCELSLPVVSAAPDFTEPAGTKISELAVACDSHPLLVTVYEAA